MSVRVRVRICITEMGRGSVERSIARRGALRIRPLAVSTRARSSPSLAPHAGPPRERAHRGRGGVV